MLHVPVLNILVVYWMNYCNRLLTIRVTTTRRTRRPRRLTIKIKTKKTKKTKRIKKQYFYYMEKCHKKNVNQCMQNICLQQIVVLS